MSLDQARVTTFATKDELAQLRGWGKGMGVRFEEVEVPPRKETQDVQPPKVEVPPPQVDVQPPQATPAA